MLTNTLLSIAQTALVYALVAMGVYISYKILDFPDLGVDSIFPLGGVISILLITKGVNAYFALIIAFIAGGFAGFITGILHVKLKISKLLSSILVMTAFISVYKVLSKVCNGVVSSMISYTKSQKTIFNGYFVKMFGNTEIGKIFLLLILVVLFKILLDLFLKTKNGFMLRTVGENEQIATSMGKDVGFYNIVGLVIADAMVGLAGAVYSQLQNYYDETSGTGMVVIALASVIIGCAIFKNAKIIKPTTSVIIGALIYTTCLYFAIIVVPTVYLKLIMALLFLIILIINNFKRSHAPKMLKGGSRNA